MAGLTLRNIAKSYGATQVIESIDLDVEDGEFVVFVGPSGCGKSTLLRMIAGLEEISGGELSIGDRVVNEVAPAKRGVAMVFQTYALYPHMTVYKNMGFGLKQAKTPPDEIDAKVRAAAEILDITPLLERTPRALSGGQRQRVAIGRAIVREPDVFLFDEPLSNLDAALRVQTRIEIARLHERLGTTMIYVTHDQVEAMTLADKIVVLRGGNIEQVGTPMDLYHNPRNMFVAGFIGSPKMNFFGQGDLTPGGAALLPDDGHVLGLRPEHLRPMEAGSALVEAVPDLIENLGEYALVHCRTASGVAFIAKTTDMVGFEKGKPVPLGADPERRALFDKASGLRILSA
ncbi:sugar ABC transporter ATP-binding protein [Jannaschia pagri]|uniref:Sugar ABC transporter ATP-binding protein n=1 Tax=Jannaschia pagri TaxID=2829797 RepID=A0ABQ4NJ65_9RHOB|nr:MULTISPECIES: sn-glycerol-3-phosphate ABC transporter ATP-binding protein UgpC [unclassified Jannaschia]GIT89632.1 sugar ABC transporter ATP-binding protein [Jannaschia sp. AI_61]GIT94260.1 sugar ABC transporter ATP-binding protein [Jannaschia sp. AI_62]